MMKRLVASCALALVFSLLPGPAQAGSAGEWPKPGATPSSSGGPEVVFSFDDGPHARYTPALLDVLNRHGVQGLFFWVGNRVAPDHRKVKEHVEITRRAVLEGHLIGTHTQNHAHLCSVRREVAAGEIDHAIARFEQITGLPMKLFRAPYGNHCPRLVEMLNARGIKHTHWDIDPHEWEDHDAKRVARHIAQQLQKLDGRGVVLLHDTTKVTTDAVDILLHWLEDENQRRRVAGQQPIRIAAPSDWIAESLDRDVSFVVRELGRWAHREAAKTRLLVPGYAHRVVSR